jgi:hypothetical protein
MKKFQMFIAMLLLVASSNGQTSLVSADRFIHLRTVYEEESDGGDSYLRAEAIDAVTVFKSSREADKERPYKVRVTTRMLKASKEGSAESWVTVNRFDEIDCVSREEAEKIAKVIVTACSGDGKPGKPDPSGAGQPSAAPESKSKGQEKTK